MKVQNSANADRQLPAVHVKFLKLGRMFQQIGLFGGIKYC